MFYEAPTAGNSHLQELRPLPWMAMNGLAGVAQVLETGSNAIQVTQPSFRARACRLTACWRSRRH